MTLGASATVAAMPATTLLAVIMNLRRAAIMLPSSPRDELMVGALGDVVPGAHQRLELGERRVHLPRRGGLFRLFLDDLGGQLLEIAQHRSRELEDLDLLLEFRSEPRERDGVLGVVLAEAIGLDGRASMVEHSP